MFGIISPFVSEKIYQNLKQEFNLKEDSIHMFKFPKADTKLIIPGVLSTFFGAILRRISIIIAIKIPNPPIM